MTETREGVVQPTPLEVQVDLNTLTPHDMVAAALQTTQSQSLASILKNKGVDPKVKRVFRSMDIAMRSVDGSDSQLTAYRYKFAALRLWNGCSLLFFTINPHDIHTPLLLYFIGDRDDGISHISLDWEDEEMASFYESQKTGNRHRLYELAVRYPDAAARAVHDTFYQTLALLFNVAPPANVKPERQHVDTMPCKKEPGIFGYVSGYMGIVEPQMRLTEHLHMLVQLFPFSHPRSYFESRDFKDTFRRVWSYFASVSFTALEAIASHLTTPAAFEAARASPLLPVTPAQRKLVGATAAEDSLNAQMTARGGVVSEDWKQQKREPFHAFTPKFYGDRQLSASAWSSLMLRDCNRGIAKCMNHVCRPATCYKGKLWSKIRYCRMYFWHWGKTQSKKKKAMVCRRYHGLQLRPRWNGHGLPPVVREPPQVGLPALERTHPLQGKVVPAVLAGPRCNHDVGILYRMPVLSKESEDALLGGTSADPTPDSKEPLPQDVEDALAQSVADSVQMVVDREFYSVSYSTKEQPRASGLLHSLHTTLENKKAYADERALLQKSDAGEEGARRTLQSLANAAQKHQHKGFPTMYAYLHGKPNYYCSHTFDYLNMEHFLPQFRDLRQKHWIDGMPYHPTVPETRAAEDWPAANVATHKRFDYQYRPDVMEHFSVYYFCAGTKIVAKLQSDTWLWHVATDAETELQRHVRLSDGDRLSRRDHPCYRDGQDPNLWWYSKTCTDLNGKKLPLDDHDGVRASSADHYRQIRLREPWRVPQIFGHIPQLPTADSTSEARGDYALFAMVLFRPWRAPGAALQAWLGPPKRAHAGDGCSARIGDALYEEFCRWRQSLRDDVDEYRTSTSASEQPSPPYPNRQEPGTAWWSAMTLARLDNLELLCAKRTPDSTKPPTTLDGLPLGSDADSQSDHKASDNESVAASSEEKEEGLPGQDAVLSENEDVPNRPLYPPAEARRCGKLPRENTAGTFQTATAFLCVPPGAHGRSAEAKYAQSYVHNNAAMQRLANDGVGDTRLLKIEDSIWTAPCGHAEHSGKQQVTLFRKLDTLEVDITHLSDAARERPADHVMDCPEADEETAATTTASTWHDGLGAAVRALHARGAPVGHTAVLDAAAFLLDQGLLNVKGEDRLNVKQCRALLHWALWLQKKMSHQWVKAGQLAAEPWASGAKPEPLRHVLIGGAGCGKTTTLLVIEALLDFFLGADSMRKAAPTNTAARLLRGDTVHALFKLPRGTLQSKGGKLSKLALKALRHRWQGSTAFAIDEISMLPPGSMHQVDMRSRDITRSEEEESSVVKFDNFFGGKAVNLSGDFLQLPPVDTPSLAQTVDAHGRPAKPVDDRGKELKFHEDEGAAKPEEKRGRGQQDFEHRLGYDLWTNQFLDVTSLDLNMRTQGVLADILRGMRAGRLDDDAWEALQGRLMTRDDPRLQRPPFSTNAVHYIVQRHQLRVAQSFCNAVRKCVQLDRRLYVSVACDEPKFPRDMTPKEKEHFQADMLRQCTLRKVKNLPGVLPLYRGMQLLLYDKLCARLLLMNGCLCILEDIIFDENETPRMGARAGDPILLDYLPTHLLLRAVDASWTLPDDHLPSLPDDVDRKGLFLLPRVTDYWTYSVPQGEGINVRRTHFKVVPADTRIVYAAQGEGFEACALDLERPPRMSPEVHWLSTYVMLSRATTLEGILLLRLCDRADLERRPPQYLLDELDRLATLETTSWTSARAALTKYKEHLSTSTWSVLTQTFAPGSTAEKSPKPKSTITGKRAREPSQVTVNAKDDTEHQSGPGDPRTPPTTPSRRVRHKASPSDLNKLVLTVTSDVGLKPAPTAPSTPRTRPPGAPLETSPTSAACAQVPASSLTSKRHVSDDFGAARAHDLRAALAAARQKDAQRRAEAVCKACGRPHCTPTTITCPNYFDYHRQKGMELEAWAFKRPERAVSEQLRRYVRDKLGPAPPAPAWTLTSVEFGGGGDCLFWSIAGVLARMVHRGGLSAQHVTERMPPGIFTEGHRAVMLALRRKAASRFHTCPALTVLEFVVTSCAMKDLEHQEGEDLAVHLDGWNPFQVLAQCSLASIATSGTVPNTVVGWTEDSDGNAEATLRYGDARAGGAPEEIRQHKIRNGTTKLQRLRASLAEELARPGNHHWGTQEDVSALSADLNLGIFMFMDELYVKDGESDARTCVYNIGHSRPEMDYPYWIALWWDGAAHYRAAQILGKTFWSADELPPALLATYKAANHPDIPP